MVWVRSEYAGELAVVSAWLAVVIPWNFTISERIFEGRLVFVRFPLVEIQYGWGLQITELNGVAIRWLPAAYRLQSTEAVASAYQTWALAAGVLLLAIGFSIIYYQYEDRIEAGPLDPVRTIGGLLIVTGGLFLGASALFYWNGIPGLPLPVGTVVLLVLGVVLLGVERRP